MEDILKIVKPLEYSGILLKVVSETIKNEAKEQKDLIYFGICSTPKLSKYVTVLFTRCKFIRRYAIR